MSDRIRYPFPLPQADGSIVIARLELPERLTAEDTERLAAFIRSLAVEEEVTT